MKSVGNMPEGSEFIWPEYSGEEIFYVTPRSIPIHWHFGHCTRFYGFILGERKIGTATLLYVRPMSFRAYFLEVGCGKRYRIG